MIFCPIEQKAHQAEYLHCRKQRSERREMLLKKRLTNEKIRKCREWWNNQHFPAFLFYLRTISIKDMGGELC